MVGVVVMKADEYLVLVGSGKVDLNSIRCVLYELLVENASLRREFERHTRRIRELECKFRVQSNQINDLRYKINVLCDRNSVHQKPSISLVGK